MSGSTLLTARLFIACDRLRMAAQAGQRIRTYEIALEVNLSEFHFARQFRLHFGRSPHQYYDEVRAAHAQQLLARGMRACEVARRVGLQRPAALRSLLRKHSG